LPHPPKWKDWYKVADKARIKRYSLRVEIGDKPVGIEVALYLPNTDVAVPSWIVIIKTRGISEDNQIMIFTGIFPEFIEAEDKAWEEAQKVIKALNQKAG
jgi:hypothetical protein